MNYSQKYLEKIKNAKCHDEIKEIINEISNDGFEDGFNTGKANYLKKIKEKSFVEFGNRLVEFSEVVKIIK